MNRPVRLLLALAATSSATLPAGAYAEHFGRTTGAPTATPYSTAGCALTHVKIDTVGANDIKIIFNGRGEGQVVYMWRDTIVTSFTVYRAAFEDSIPYFARLFVTNSDLNGRPVASSIIYAGPIVQGGFGDGIHPFPLVFDINPPLALPHRGLYYFNVTEASCLGNFVLLSDTTNRYLFGGEWRTGASGCDPFPGSLAGPFYPMTDLIFDVATCSAVTPVRRASWGALKIRYK